MASGPERRGVKGWRFLSLETVVWAWRERAWVRVGSVGEGAAAEGVAVEYCGWEAEPGGILVSAVVDDWGGGGGL